MIRCFYGRIASDVTSFVNGVLFTSVNVSRVFSMHNVRRRVSVGKPKQQADRNKLSSNHAGNNTSNHCYVKLCSICSFIIHLLNAVEKTP